MLPRVCMWFLCAVCFRALDLVFVVDGSTAVGAANFETLKTAVRSAALFFGISSFQARVSAITYSTNVNGGFFLSDVRDDVDLGKYPRRLSFSFSLRWHRSPRKGPYALRPVSQQSPQGCPRNSAHICLVEHRSFSTLEGGLSATSFLHSSSLRAINAVMLWPVHVQNVPQASEHLCPAKLQTRREEHSIRYNNYQYIYVLNRH